MTQKKKKSQTDALAEIYARSLFELADEAGGLSTIEATKSELDEIVNISITDHTFSEFLNSRIISTNDRNKSLKNIFGNNTISDLLLRFFLVLNQKERLGHIAPIAEALTQLYWIRTGKLEVEVFTATPMNDHDIAHVKEQIKEVLDKEPIIHNTIDPALIGGLRLRIGDKMIDASVSGKLRQIKESLNTQGTEAIRDKLNTLIDE